MIKQIALVNSLIIGMLVMTSMYSLYAMIAASQLKYCYMLKCDTLLTEHAQESIRLVLEQSWPMLQQLPQDIWHKLQTLFPFLDTCTISYTAHGCAIIALTTQKLLVKINENVFITQGGLLVEQNYMPADDIPEIRMERCSDRNLTLQEIDLAFLAWAQALDMRVHEQYDICWKNKTCIVLTEKNDPAASITCHAGQEISQELLQICTRIKTAGKKGQKWKADVRFKDLIIVGERG